MGIDVITLALAKKYVDDSLLGVGTIQGKDGIGISRIEKISTENLKDTYKITLTDNSSFDFVITNGKSAYEIALENGFKGTEIEWLNSLKGTSLLENITFEIRDGNLYAIYND